GRPFQFTVEVSGEQHVLIKRQGADELPQVPYVLRLAIAGDDQKHIWYRLPHVLQAVQDTIDTFLGMKSPEKEQPSLPFGFRESRQKMRPQVVDRSRACPRAERDKLSGRQRQTGQRCQPLLL